MKVGVVLINWNGGEFTIPCIESLKAGSIKPDQIVVVDNASKDDSPYNIASQFPEIDLIRNTSNNGFAGGCNQGIQLLLNKNMDYIWLLNNDTVVAKDCLEILLDIARQRPMASAFSGKIYYEQPKYRIWYAGAYRHPLHLGFKHIGEHGLECKNDGGAIEVPFISGCFMFVPSGVWRRYGGFVESYIAYCEDSEWCWRVSKAKETILYVPRAVIWHKLSASVRKNLNDIECSTISPEILYLTNRNHLWSIRKHATGLKKWFSLIVNIGIQFRNMLMLVSKGKLNLFRSNAKAVAVGLFSEVPSAHFFLEHK